MAARTATALKPAQKVQRELEDLQLAMSDPDRARSQRVTAAMLQMKKLDIAGLKRAYAA